MVNSIQNMLDLIQTTIEVMIRCLSLIYLFSLILILLSILVAIFQMYQLLDIYNFYLGRMDYVLVQMVFT